VVTFHPVTLENDSSAEQFEALLSVCHRHNDMKFIFSKANADANGRVINQMLDEYVRTHENSVAFTSLGMVRYLSAIKYSSVVIGNSSSGILEVPSFGLPTINIGDRQKGRLQADSIINCMPITDEIEKAMALAISTEFRNKARLTINPNGDGNASEKIVDKLREFLQQNNINLKKKFYDCEMK
jgi:GDP/UDP-N,N'-diacetylbacillosamine 2-epimerase (hydrolysing)